MGADTPAVKRVTPELGHSVILEQAEVLCANWGVERPIDIERSLEPGNHRTHEIPLRAVAERVESADKADE